MHLYADGAVVAGGYSLPVAIPLGPWSASTRMVRRSRVRHGWDRCARCGRAERGKHTGLAVLSDGSIAACGYRSANGADDKPVIAVFHADGGLDTGFGDQGLVVVPYAAPQLARAMAIQVASDDKLLVAGFQWYNPEAS